MDSFNWFILLTTCLSFANAELKIVDLKVPSTIESGINDEVILDCDYEVSNETGLEIKWFYDNGGEQIYQWIPNNRKPQALGFLKNRIDLEYKVSDDPNTMYRALRIKDVTTDLSGNYTCKVTSFYNEATATKNMIIYEAAKEFELTHMEEANMFLCSASGIFPEPKLNAYILGINKNATLDCSDDDNNDDNDDDDNDDDTTVTKSCKPVSAEEPTSIEDDDDAEQTEDGTFNITSSYTYSEEDLPEITTFVCELWIPGTNYKKIIKQDYYPGGFPSRIETQIESDNDYEFPTNATDTESSGVNILPDTILLFLTMFVLQRFV